MMLEKQQIEIGVKKRRLFGGYKITGISQALKELKNKRDCNFYLGQTDLPKDDAKKMIFQTIDKKISRLEKLKNISGLSAINLGCSAGVYSALGLYNQLDVNSYSGDDIASVIDNSNAGTIVACALAAGAVTLVTAVTVADKMCNYIDRNQIYLKEIRKKF